METTWRVREVTMKPGVVRAELERVIWFKANPEHAAWLASGSDEDAPEEFVDAHPGEPGADAIEEGGNTLVIDITDSDIELRPLDNVRLTLTVLAPVNRRGIVVG